MARRPSSMGSPAILVADRIRSDQENLDQLVEVLDVLRIGIDAFLAGRRSAWMIVSAHLHQLLTDNTSRPLALRVLRSLSLHPMYHEADPSCLFQLPFRIRMGPGVFNVEIFDLQRKRIPLSKWLQQIAYIAPAGDKGQLITIAELIRQPRHEAGGAHFGSQVKPLMQVIEEPILNVGTGEWTYRDYLVAIGDYVQRNINLQLMGAIGAGFLQKGELDKGGQHCSAALALADELGDLHGQQDQLQNMSAYHDRKAEHDKARDCAQKALEICRQIGDEVTLPAMLRNAAGTVMNNGLAAYQAGRFAQATAEYRLGLTMAAEADETVQYLALLGNLGLAYEASGDRRLAVAAWLVGLALPVDTEQLDDEAAAHANRALALTSYKLAEVRSANPGLIEQVLTEGQPTFEEATGRAHYLQNTVEEMLSELNAMLDLVPLGNLNQA